MSTATTLYILYNADASILGKLNYSYRKLTSSKDSPACAACDLTHGGLHLDETEAWKAVKADLQKEGVRVEQLHRDELSGEVSGVVFRSSVSSLAFPLPFSVLSFILFG